MSDIQSQRNFKRNQLQHQSSFSQNNHSFNKYLPNAIHVQQQISNTIYVPIYVRAYLNELMHVSLANDSVKIHATLLVTYPILITGQTFSKLKSIKKVKVDELANYIKNNLTLEIGSRYIDLIIENSEPKSYVNQHSIQKSKLKMSDNSRFLTLKNNKNQKQSELKQQLFNEQFYVQKVQNSYSKKYNTFKIEGHFNCSNQLKNTYFPYHQIKASLDIKINQLFFNDIIIRYNVMNLSKQDDDVAKLFVMNFNQDRHSHFGIYSINRKYQSIQWGKSQYDLDNQISWDSQYAISLILVEKVSFKFLISAYNLPFMLRYHIPLLILCTASITCFFISQQNINGLFGNTILLSIAYISLLSNFRKSNFSSNSFSLYQCTILAFVSMLCFLIIHQTISYYDKKNKRSTYSGFKLVSLTVIILFMTLNAFILIFFGIKARDNLTFIKETWSFFRQNLIWNQQILTNCVSFKHQEGLKECQSNKNRPKTIYQEE